MGDDRLIGKVNRVEGGLPPNAVTRNGYVPGYIYAEDDLGHHVVFSSDRCDQYRIGDKVRIEVTRLDEPTTAGEALLDKPWLRKGIVDE